jgi:UDP-2,4-diacetamido-2,4,6-trideoxy-beta-L-altropyranose hydrolase
MVNNKVSILTESGKDIGFGHYTRCTALYHCLKENNFDVRFYVYEKEHQSKDDFIVSFDWLNFPSKINSRSSEEIVIIDSYLADKYLYNIIKEKFKALIIIDDYNRIQYPASYIINPNVFCHNLDYSNQTAKIFGGKEYVILRSEFINAPFVKFHKHDKLNLLVTIGGSDFRNLLPTLIDILKNIDSNITVIAPEGNIEFHQNIKNLGKQSSNQMVDEIQNADIVISACGQTLHELVALGKSTIGICLDIDQLPNQNYYFDNLFLKDKIHWNDNDLKIKILNQINYFNNLENRLKIVHICSTLIDKNGVFKIVELIKNMYDKLQ